MELINDINTGYVPLYRQIKRLITDALVTGEWAPGQPIPSEIELAQRYKVSQGTVRKAISELAKTSKTRTIGQLLYDLVPLFASPDFFTKDWMLDIMNEYHWIKNWNVSPGNLDNISAFRLDCWSIVENEFNQINKSESQKNVKTNI